MVVCRAGAAGSEFSGFHGKLSWSGSVDESGWDVPEPVAQCFRFVRSQWSCVAGRGEWPGPGLVDRELP